MRAFFQYILFYVIPGMPHPGVAGVLAVMPPPSRAALRDAIRASLRPEVVASMVGALMLAWVVVELISPANVN